MGKVAKIQASVINQMHFDDFIRSMLMGINKFNIEEDIEDTLIIRGLGGGSQKAIKRCWSSGLPFYAIDTGYFGNGKHKIWHRITYNALQNMNQISNCNESRLTQQLGQWNQIYKKFTTGDKILVCPPSDKVMNLFGQGTAREWTSNLVKQIETLTDRPIEIRMKPSRSARVTDSTIQEALHDNVHCLITYNSIAATEALLEGKPAITLGPNAAQLICETDLANINNPKIPTEDEMFNFLKHLSYSQFTQEEMKNGIAWKILQETQV